MKNNGNKRIIPWACIAPLALAVGLSACGGSSSSGTTAASGTTSPDGETLSSGSSESFDVPSEISAVPTSDSGSGSSAAPRSFGGAIRSLASSARALAAADLPADSDYKKTKASTFVEERTLEVFDIIEQVLNAASQTNYKDEVNNGPYKALIAWEEEQNGRDIKQLQEWTVESRLIVAEHPDGTSDDTLRMLAWIPETTPSGDEVLIKAEIKIYTAPTEDPNNEGAYTDFGEWDMNVAFDADATGVDANPAGFFAAQARINSDGTSTLALQDRGERNEFGLVEVMKGVLVRSDTSGYGKIQHPDWETCYDPNSGTDCNALNEFPSKRAQYAYNADYLAVGNDTNDDGTVDSSEATFKDRDLANATAMTHRYGLFYKEAGTVNNVAVAEGENVLKNKSFGFPLTYLAHPLDGNGDPLLDNNGDPVEFIGHGYYGAWQGRHEIWGSGENDFTAFDGSNTGTASVFTKQDVAPGEVAPQYYLAEFGGTLSKRSLVDANVADIKGVAVETWLNKNYNLTYLDAANAPGNNAGWYACEGDIKWSDMSCWEKGQIDTTTKALTLFGESALAQFIVGQNDRRFVDIGGDDGQNWVMYVYEDSNTSDGNVGAFYPADWGNDGLAKTGDPALTPSNGDNLNVNLGGSVYIQYTGTFDNSDNTTTGWVQKTMTGFDEDTWTPTFDANGDSQFTPSRDAEYYMNANGVNYVVKVNGNGQTDSADDYDAKIELQTAANPRNTNASATILPANTSYLAEPWNQDVKYELVEDANDQNGQYLLLKVQSIATGAQSELSVGATLTDDKWGLVAYNSSNQPLDVNGDPVTVDDWGFPTGQTRPVEFNWEYKDSTAGDFWGSQQFLVNKADADSSAITSDSYAILDDPISLDPIQLTNAASEQKTFQLQYDGWMHGLPDLYFELQKSDWVMTADIADKVVQIPAGTVVTDSATTDSNGDPVEYFVKPLETSIFLDVLDSEPAGAPDVSQADSVDLDADVPSFTAHNMGAVPTEDWDGNDVVIKYTEGKPVE
jgi:hypothetical protein